MKIKKETTREKVMKEWIHPRKQLMKKESTCVKTYQYGMYFLSFKFVQKSKMNTEQNKPSKESHDECIVSLHFSTKTWIYISNYEYIFKVAIKRVQYRKRKNNS